jgi:hypothetical protein
MAQTYCPICPACGFEKHALVGKRTSSWASNLMPLGGATLDRIPGRHHAWRCPAGTLDEQIEIKKDCASMDACFGAVSAPPEVAPGRTGVRAKAVVPLRERK